MGNGRARPGASPCGLGTGGECQLRCRDRRAGPGTDDERVTAATESLGGCSAPSERDGFEECGSKAVINPPLLVQDIYGKTTDTISFSFRSRPLLAGSPAGLADDSRNNGNNGFELG